MRELVVFADELVNLGLDEAVLVVEHADVVLEGLSLSQQVQVVVVASEVDPSLLLYLDFKLINDVFLLVHGLRQCCIVIADLPGLFLDDHSHVLQLVNLHILHLQLLLNLLLLPLQILDLRVQLVQFDLLSFDLLIVVCKFLLALLLFFLRLGKLLLAVEHVILAPAQVLLGDPALALFVALLVDKVTKLNVPLRHLLLQLSVAAADSIDLLLLLHAFVGFCFHVFLHLVDLGLSLPNAGLHFVHFLVQIVHSALLQGNLPLHLSDLVARALHHDFLRLAPVFRLVALPH